jgi:hypothetical protein
VIVDVHTHFLRADSDLTPQVAEDCRRGGADPAILRFSSEDHLRATAAVDCAVVFGLQAARTGWMVPNDAVAEQVRRAPERLIFFASVDPWQCGFIAELERGHRDLHCQGVKLGPIYQGVHPLDQKYYQIYGYCQRHGLPILTHMATTFSSGVPLEYARPAHMDQVAIDFPDLKIVLPHLGHPWEGETIAVIRKQPNVFAEVSALYYRPWQFYNSMRLVVEYHAERKVLFGSDFPFTTPTASLAGVRGMNAVIARSGLPAVPADVLEGIITRDALKLLGIDPPAKGARG